MMCWYPPQSLLVPGVSGSIGDAGRLISRRARRMELASNLGGRSSSCSSSAVSISIAWFTLPSELLSIGDKEMLFRVRRMINLLNCLIVKTFTVKDNEWIKTYLDYLLQNYR